MFLKKDQDEKLKIQPVLWLIEMHLESQKKTNVFGKEKFSSGTDEKTERF